MLLLCSKKCTLQKKLFTLLTFLKSFFTFNFYFYFDYKSFHSKEGATAAPPKRRRNAAPPEKEEAKQHHPKEGGGASSTIQKDLRWGLFSENRITKKRTQWQSCILCTLLPLLERQRPMHNAMSGLLGEHVVCMVSVFLLCLCR